MFIGSNYIAKSLTIKESYHSGLKSLVTSDFGLLLLDMSMPTWDRSPNENGGDYEKFGGLKILKELKRKNKLLPTILITMFDNFGESDNSVTLKQLEEVLQNDYPDCYLGSVFYRSDLSQWENDLDQILKTFFND
jgi:CheY-like chemotaxis protein